MFEDNVVFRIAQPTLPQPFFSYCCRSSFYYRICGALYPEMDVLTCTFLIGYKEDDSASSKYMGFIVTEKDCLKAIFKLNMRTHS